MGRRKSGGVIAKQSVWLESVILGSFPDPLQRLLTLALTLEPEAQKSKRGIGGRNEPAAHHSRCYTQGLLTSRVVYSQ